MAGMAGAMGGAAAGAQSTADLSVEAFALVATQMGFACPISQDIFQDPVVAADGYSYERRSITEWLVHKDTSPMTNNELTHKRLTPNRNLKSSIETWLELQHGEARVEKRRKTSAEAIKKFLEALAELVRTDNIADVVKGLKLGDDLELHTRVLDALCTYSYGGTENRARIDVGGGLEASVATIKVHMLPSRNGWRLACLDACSILEMAVVNSGVDGHAILAAIHRAGGIMAVAGLVKARHTDPEVLMRALNLLCEFLNIVSLPFALDVAEMVVGGVVQPIVEAMELHVGNFGVLSCACRTLGELARDVEGRATAENFDKISAGGGLLAVVRAVKGLPLQTRPSQLDKASPEAVEAFARIKWRMPVTACASDSTSLGTSTRPNPNGHGKASPEAVEAFARIKWRMPEVGVVCPYCGESASGLAAFERHMEWHSLSRFVVTVSFWRYGSHLESSVKIDGLGSPLLEQVLAKFKTSEKWWGGLPKEGVRVFLGDETRFVLTELDARASLTGIRAQGGVHVVGGTVQALAGSMRLHIFDGSDGCRAKECAGSVFMQRKAGGFW